MEETRQLEIQSLLSHEPENINLWVQKGLLQERFGYLEKAYESYRVVASLNSSPVSDALLERVASKWPLVPEIERYLLQLAIDNDNFRLAWEALLRMGPRIVSRLLVELKDPCFVPKERIITLLGRLKDPRATIPLLKFLPDYPIPVIQALRSLADPRAVPKLVDLYSKNDNPLIRRMAIWSLGRFLGPSSIMTLLQAGWEDENHHVRIEAHESLEDLTRNKGKQILPLLKPMLQDESSFLRIGAVWTLALISDREALFLLIQTLEDSVPEVQIKAIESLGKRAHIDAIEPLMKLLEKEESLTQPILEALGKIGYRPPLREALSDPDPWKKFLGAKLLFRLGEAPGRFMLELLSSHIDRRLSWAAKQALKWG